MKMHRREYLSKSLRTVGQVLFGSLFFSSYGRAIEHLNRLPDPDLNDMQNSILNQPKRGVLLAEIGNCSQDLEKLAKVKCINEKAPNSS
jgi:hypothetical protein